jgi:uncharacterized Zn-finger protein
MGHKQVFETLEVDSHEVYCDGGSVELGHPRVYLHIDADEGKVVCPYCSLTFLLKAAA